MRCPSCGSELADNSQFCPYCGTKIEVTTQNQQNNYDPNYGYNPNDYDRPDNYNQSSDSFNQFNQQVPPAQRKKESPVFGILAIIFSLLGGWLGLAFAIMGIATYKEKNNRTMCFVAIGLQVFWFILGFFIGFTGALGV